MAVSRLWGAESSERWTGSMRAVCAGTISSWCFMGALPLWPSEFRPRVQVPPFGPVLVLIYLIVCMHQAGRDWREFCSVFGLFNGV